jgi:hypothetical protein
VDCVAVENVVYEREIHTGPSLSEDVPLGVVTLSTEMSKHTVPATFRDYTFLNSHEVPPPNYLSTF